MLLLGFLRPAGETARNKVSGGRGSARERHTGSRRSDEGKRRMVVRMRLGESSELDEAIEAVQRSATGGKGGRKVKRTCPSYNPCRDGDEGMGQNDRRCASRSTAKLRGKEETSAQRSGEEHKKTSAPRTSY